MIISALYAGFMIGFAALLSCCIENQILAALFFSIGLLYIRINKFYLFTGQIQNLKDKTTTLKDLAIGLLFNIVGVLVVILLFIAFNNPIAIIKFAVVAAAKWSFPWYHYLVSGICCGILMTIATKKESPLWLSSLCVMAFILAGFNHCIADFFYIFSGNLLLWLCIVIGNLIGGYIAAPWKMK